MSKTDNLKLEILVNDRPVYFGSPVFYSQKKDGDGVTLIIETEIGNQTKQKISIHLKNPTYVESTPCADAGDVSLESDPDSSRS
jgi:hypothetical protein